MTIRNLEGFFSPKSIAVLGPCRHTGPITARLLECLQSFEPGHAVSLVGIDTDVPIAGPRCASLDDLPQMPDLAIYLGRAEVLPKTIEKLGSGGTRAVLIPSPGYETWPEDLMQACRNAARKFNVRLIGPGTLGIAVPSSGLNALLSAETPARGDIAFFSRSSAVLNATLSWAKTHNTGFSSVVSLGARTDVDLGDLIDYFAQDYRTRSIVLHLEGIAFPRKFISAARAAARSKPVIVIRSGKSLDSGGSGRTHAGRLAATDLVYETVFRRTGLLRVFDLDEMFEALETLSHIRVPRCNEIAVIANGRSLASLAVDRLQDLGAQFATLGADTRKELETLSRPASESDTKAASGSVILTESATPDQISSAIKTVLKDPSVDGAVVLQAASAFTPLKSIAKAVTDASAADRKRTGRKKALVAGLIGSDGAIRAELTAAKIPNFASPAEAARSLMHLAHDAQARAFLMAVPPSLPTSFSPDVARARAIVEGALAQHRTWLDPEDVCEILKAYELPIMETRMAATAGEAAELSAGFFETSRHCVAKLVSPDLPFKSRIDGVRLGLDRPDAVRAAAQELIDNTKRDYPGAAVAGISVHPMLEDRHGMELYLGLAETRAFGPVLVFGHGGTSIEESRDIALELPPLDLKLAEA
ncbi:MAG: acetate--CoA ligase family protein, partial [Pseudomonadota bacterium]